MIGIGEKIREARIARNLTQKELGNVLGLNEEVIINYENNKIYYIEICRVWQHEKNKKNVYKKWIHDIIMLI